MFLGLFGEFFGFALALWGWSHGLGRVRNLCFLVLALLPVSTRRCFLFDAALLCKVWTNVKTHHCTSRVTTEFFLVCFLMFPLS